MAAREGEKLLAAYTSPEFELAVSELCEVAGISKSDLVRAAVSRTLIELAEQQPPKFGSPLHRAKMSAALTGKPKSPEAVEKTARAHRGRPLSEPHKQAISRGKRGKKIARHSEAHKAKLKEARLRTIEKKRAAADG